MVLSDAAAFAGAMIGIALTFETCGVWFRLVGAANGAPTVGYSSHVRIATAGRFFILLGAPLIGFLVDQEASRQDIARAGLIAFGVYLACIASSSFAGGRFWLALFRKLNPKFKGEVCPSLRAPSSATPTFFFLSSLSFLFTASGILGVNLLATIFYDSRAMLVQLATAVTMLGTLIHVFFIDPALARTADGHTEDLSSLISSFIIGRSASAVSLLAVYGGILVA